MTIDPAASTAGPLTFTVIARNLPEHARNAIHTDAGAQAAGFPRALVAGVTTYAYLTHPVVAAWGAGWLAHGVAEVRFRSPVFEHDVVDCVPVPDGDAVVIEARCGDGPPRATLRSAHGAGPAVALRPGEPLPRRSFTLAGEWGDDYGARAGDHDDTMAGRGIVHPAVWPALANAVVHADVARGAWVHTRSIVRHHRCVAVGEVAELHSVVVERFHRYGERAVLDVHVVVDGEVVTSIEHEAIVALDVPPDPR